MQMQLLPGDFSVCKLTSAVTIDLRKPFTFLSVTDDEISLVCAAGDAPDNTTAVKPGWRGLKICGTLDFGMVGVVAKISALLAAEGISIFIVSTYNTDYIFVKRERCDLAVATLRENGYDIS